jgi:hypothetical protein
MEELFEKENSINQAGEDTAGQETSTGESGTPTETELLKKELAKVSKLNEQLFARVKKAETKVEEALKTFPKVGQTTNPSEIVQILSAFDGLDASEKSRLIQEARLKGISLEDAKKDEDFVLWQTAKRQKVEEEKKVIPPSTKQGEDISSPQAKIRRFKSGEMTSEEEEDFLVETGAYRRPVKQREG